MIRTKFLFTMAAAALVAASSCSKYDHPALYTPPPADTVRYTATDSDFVNPERGFYRVAETTADGYAPLDIAQLKAWRGLEQADGGNYSVYSSLVFRDVVMTGYTNKPLDDALLQNIKSDFDVARQAGMKLILRFCYSVTPTPGSCPEGFICPPYGDEPKAIVLAQIAQLKPLLQANDDVIACLQMGFVGMWGENYYSDYFGDPSTNGAGQLYDSNWRDKSDVLRALLDALPADRMIQVRTPQMKQRYLYGPEAPVSSAPMTAADAFTGSDLARIGFHNDCFLSSPNDYGTYNDYGNSTSGASDAYGTLHAYASADGKFTVVGGETCDDTYSPENDCETAGKAQTEMSSMHYSFLNCAYNNDVNDDWQTQGCMAAIKRNLGYRFVLQNGIFPKDPVTHGMQLAITLNLANEGYASPFNPRPLKLILRSKADGKEFSYDVSADPRTWFTGTTALTIKVVTDAAMPAGQYELFLFLPDAASSIAARPEYAIRLANAGVWESATGYNDLGAAVEIR